MNDTPLRQDSSPPIVVVMGVSGSGKTTIGAALAERLGCAYEEGDLLHPPANIAKMRSGHALTDADRAPWLDAIADWIAAKAARGEAGVISCSALKRRYRDRLRATFPGLAFIFLNPPADVLRARLADRHGHFLPASLLDSQLATLEPPEADERVFTRTGTEEIAAACDSIVVWLRQQSLP